MSTKKLINWRENMMRDFGYFPCTFYRTFGRSYSEQLQIQRKKNVQHIVVIANPRSLFLYSLTLIFVDKENDKIKPHRRKTTEF